VWRHSQEEGLTLHVTQEQALSNSSAKGWGAVEPEAFRGIDHSGTLGNAAIRNYKYADTGRKSMQSSSGGMG
jgi:hypothetical protein